MVNLTPKGRLQSDMKACVPTSMSINMINLHASIQFSIILDGFNTPSIKIHMFLFSAAVRHTRLGMFYTFTCITGKNITAYESNNCICIALVTFE